jgi:hypothetical protein
VRASRAAMAGGSAGVARVGAGTGWNGLGLFEWKRERSNLGAGVWDPSVGWCWAGPATIGLSKIGCCWASKRTGTM